MEYPWSSMDYLWSSMECHVVPCMNFHVMPWNSMEFLGVSMEFHEMLCSSMEFHGVSMKFDTHSCQFVMRIDRNSLIKQLVNLLATCLSLHFLLERKKENILKLLKSINSA